MNNKVELIDNIRNNFIGKNILVIGDLMVDEYITGKVKRISPEAPIPILEYSSRRLEAGGASNVAHNIRSLGATVTVIGTAANDDAGLWLRDHFMSLNIKADMIIAEEGRQTTLKTRYATKGQQLLRVDNEDLSEITNNTINRVMSYIENNISNFDAIVMSDYCKGFFSNAEFIQKIIKICHDNDVIVSIDSKSKDIYAFSGATFVKPNNLELENAVNIKMVDEDSINKAGQKYLKMSGTRALVVTRGSKGISLFMPEQQRKDFPAKDVQVYDVCGAGDTVISVISLSLCCGITIEDAIRLANYAAGVVITKIGTVAISLEELINSIED